MTCRKNLVRAIDGAAFIFDEPEQVPAVWGSGERVLWAAGEPLFLVGPQGVGKTTLLQQLALCRHGLGQGQLLGADVQPDPRRVLYVAADRPRQAARSFRRMVGEQERSALEHFRVWRGPLPFDLAAGPELLAEFAERQEAGTVFIDSLKDVALDLSKDETGSRINLALQYLIASGIEVAVAHHQRKGSGDKSKPPRALEDVYGSTWLTAGAGSVLLLWGKPGDPIVELRHLKQPAEEVGPWKLVHDHSRGRTAVHEAPDVLELVQRSPRGLSAPDAAQSIFETTSPTPAQIEKARRKLEALVPKEAEGWRPKRLIQSSMCRKGVGRVGRSVGLPTRSPRHPRRHLLEDPRNTHGYSRARHSSCLPPFRGRRGVAVGACRARRWCGS